jgi:hypothetical protein
METQLLNIAQAAAAIDASLGGQCGARDGWMHP